MESEVSMNRPQSHRSQQPEYEPSIEEIEAAKAEIQKEWTPAEKRRRANQKTLRELARKDRPEPETHSD